GRISAARALVRAKSPRCQISSPSPTVAFQRAIIPASIAATEANGRGYRLSTRWSPKCVSLMKKMVIGYRTKGLPRVGRDAGQQTAYIWGYGGSRLLR